MKKRSPGLLLKILVPAIFIIAVLIEYLRYFHFRLVADDFSINLWTFLTNGMYGFTAGLIYLLKERTKTGKWSLNPSRFFLIFIPLLILCLYLICNSKVDCSTLSNGFAPKDSMYMYTYYRFPDNLSYFSFGFFIMFIFRKSDKTKNERGYKWIPSLIIGIIITAIMLIFKFEIKDYWSNTRAVYEVALTNTAFGLILGIIAKDHLFKKPLKFNLRCFFLVCVPILIIGFLPYRHIYFSYINPEGFWAQVPVKNYSIWMFLIQSYFIKVLQILSGYLLSSCTCTCTCGEQDAVKK